MTAVAATVLAASQGICCPARVTEQVAEAMKMEEAVLTVKMNAILKSFTKNTGIVK